jgi:hypothetical protein
MTTMHRVTFPRYAEDVASGKRTLLHLLGGDLEIGDGLTLVAHPNMPRARVATIMKVERVPLCPLSDDDLRRLNAERDEYLARWDALHPEAASGSSPMIYRIEFAYGFDEKTLPASPEWSLAT